MSLLQKEFARVCDVPSDINEFCHLLQETAFSHPHITEMGVRYGNSTIAFLAGRPKRLISYDILCQIDLKKFGEMAIEAGTEFIYLNGSSIEVEIEPTDVLFLDTLHNALHVYAELKQHHTNVRKQILIHDTDIYGIHGDDGAEGIQYAITKFLGRHANWSLTKQYANCNGLTILSRNA